MTYIKLLTVLAGLALLTACGGAATPANTGDTGGVNTTDCTQTPFHDDCLRNNAPALLLRQTMCLADSTTDDSCGAVIEGVCMDDPFNSNNTCMADTYLPNRIAECIKGGEADEGKCATITTDAEKNTMVIGCLTNPFDIVCAMTVTDFTTYAATARMNRLTFCNDGGNVADDLCTGNNLVIICGVDPFNAICFTDDTYLSPRVADCIKAENTEAEKCNTLLSDSTMNTELTACLTNPFTPSCEASESAFNTHANTARMNRESFCDMAGNNTKALCMGANLMGVCELDPLNAICTDAIYVPARIPYCSIRANAGEPACENVLTRPNVATWLQSFATELSDTPATNSTFIRGTADGVNLGTNILENLRTLNFNDVFDDGNMTDGLAFFIATNQAGIFSGTDLGAALPLTQRPSATWRGFIQANNGITTATEFELTVGFTGTGGTLVALIPTSFATLAFDINGTFDEKGVIRGNVVRGRYASDVSGCTPLTVGGNPNTSPTCFNSADVENATLTLSGIIGAEGAVGVFQGIAVVGNAPYSGGFLAKPPE